MKLRRIFTLLSVFIFAMLLAVSPTPSFEKQKIPQYPGDDNPMHNGQPMWCQNFSTKEYEGNCDCYATKENGRCNKHTGEDGNGDGPDSYQDNGDDHHYNYMPRCGVHCRKDMCQCQRKCET